MSFNDDLGPDSKNKSKTKKKKHAKDKALSEAYSEKTSVVSLKHITIIPKFSFGTRKH